MAVSRFIILPEKKELLLQLLQWMSGHGYAIDLSTRDLILKNSRFFGHELIKETLSKHQSILKGTRSHKRKE